MEVISVIVMFIFGNMNDQEHRMTQYVPMESLSSCMKEVRILKKKETDYTKDAFCGPALVELSSEEEIITLHNEMPEGAKMVKKKITYRKKKNNPVAKMLKDPEFRQKKVANKKIYNRKVDDAGLLKMLGAI